MDDVQQLALLRRRPIDPDGSRLPLDAGGEKIEDLPVARLAGEVRRIEAGRSSPHSELTGFQPKGDTQRGRDIADRGSFREGDTEINGPDSQSGLLGGSISWTLETDAPVANDRVFSASAAHARGKVPK
ncbi:MAG: hypothetical protein AB7V43_10920 [Acidimicrobiia bacterium]